MRIKRKKSKKNATSAKYSVGYSFFFFNFIKKKKCVFLEIFNLCCVNVVNERRNEIQDE